MTDRRYSEVEVATILERATEAHVSSQRQLPPTEGMTLAELQDIGREVGIAPEALALAAKEIDASGQSMSRTFLGLPIGVGLSVELGRKLTDDEWERVVVDLRETFDAKGKQSREGSFRQWTNGNLQALLEPSATGHRLRLRTLKADARGMIFGGLVMFGLAGTTAAMIALREGINDRGLMVAISTLAVMGFAMLGSGAFPLPAWARLRRRQMEEVAARTSAVASLAPERDESIKE